MGHLKTMANCEYHNQRVLELKSPESWKTSSPPTRPGYVNMLLLKMAIEIVSFPIKNCDFP